MPEPLHLFAACPPGLEDILADEIREAGFAGVAPVPGGVDFTGDWAALWRANLVLRGATRILARLGGFMAFHLAQLDKRARKFPWDEVLRADVPVKVQVTTRRSKIYHAGAAQQRIERALTEGFGLTLSPDAPLTLRARIDDNKVTFSVDTSGESLHKRGHKQAVNKAPMRETLAALLLRKAGYRGAEPVFDPMCGSGTFPIEAAEIAMGLAAGRSRSFAFEHLASFDADAFARMKSDLSSRETALRFAGSDRDTGAVHMAQQNATRAAVDAITSFSHAPITDATPPEGPPGLVIVNPPYGQRVGNRKPLFALYGSFGEVMRTRFSGWRVALVTSDPGLAKATGLTWSDQSAPIPHGGLKIWLWQTGSLP